MKNREKGLPPLKKKIFVYESKEKEEKFSFFSREAYARIIIIDLTIVKLFVVCSVIFPLKKKGVST